MKSYTVLLVLILFCFLGIKSQDQTKDLFEKNGEIYFKFEIENKSLINDLTKIISIDNLSANTVFAYANKNEFVSFQKYGIAFTILPHPNEGFDPTMATFEQIKSAKIWNFYPTYDAYVSLMYQFESDYPDLCDVFSIGQSINGREILVAKISDNVGTNENEPEFLYTSSMHGDELTGFPLMLNLIDSLLDNYGTISRMTKLVDSIEIYINPLANPDGTYAGGNGSVSGATRYNANFVDLNRNYPDPQDGQHPDGNAWQSETIHFMNFAESRDFDMSANFHGGTEVVNYPWDTWPHLTEDDAWWQYVCHEYADTAQLYSPSNYMNGYNDGITNGYAWYEVAGGRQDYMNYNHQCREVTIELSDVKLISEALLDDHWEYNRRSLLNYMEQCLFGIRGVITDANTGLPIKAEVYIVDHEADSSWVYSSLPVGNYHRFIFAGTYDVRVSAPCYQTQVIQNIVVQNKATTILDVQLIPDEDAVDFSANSTNVFIGEAVNFTDFSCGNPAIWEWTFNGGNPSSSIFQNPTGIVYNIAGEYSVKLKISDGINTDSITKVNYISVIEEIPIFNGTVSTCNGNFYDSGGPFGSYSNNEDIEMTIYPSSVNGKIKMDFTFFDIEDHSSCDYDYLIIYDGPDILSPVIGTYCGTDSPGTLVSTHGTGALTFVFYSDISVVGPGWEAVISCESDMVELDLKVFLEGPYNGMDMYSQLIGFPDFPLSQPFNIAPWNYSGTESVVSVPNPNVVDWILVELRDAPNASLAVAATKVDLQAAFILRDGSVVGMDGFSNLEFNIPIVDQLFVVIWHKNHLGIMSAIPLNETGGIYSYDFSSGSDQAYGSESQNNLGAGIYGMISGDANADGVINDNDGTALWYSETGESGYLGSDVNLNGQSNNQDKNDFWYVNYNKITQVPD